MTGVRAVSDGPPVYRFRNYLQLLAVDDGKVDRHVGVVGLQAGLLHIAQALVIAMLAGERVSVAPRVAVGDLLVIIQDGLHASHLPHVMPCRNLKGLAVGTQAAK